MFGIFKAKRWNFKKIIQDLLKIMLQLNFFYYGIKGFFIKIFYKNFQPATIAGH